MILFYQDLKSRAVNWVLFPLLTILLIFQRISASEPLSEIIKITGYNMLFLSFQFLLLFLYFSIRRRRWVNISKGLIGWGDILLLASLCVYFSPLNFIMFYIASLFVVICVWICWKLVTGSNDRSVPLAGLQALLFAVCLLTSLFVPVFNLTSDAWLAGFLY